MCWSSTGKAGVSKIVFRPCDGSASQLFAFALYGNGYTVTAMSACKLCFEGVYTTTINEYDYVSTNLNEVTLSKTCDVPSSSNQIWSFSGSYPSFPPLSGRRLRTLAAPPRQHSDLPLPEISPPTSPSALSSSGSPAAAAGIPGGPSASSNGMAKAPHLMNKELNRRKAKAKAASQTAKERAKAKEKESPPAPRDAQHGPQMGE